jgi:hypothetical protein
MSADLVRDPTDELVVFSVPPAVLDLPPDLRDDYCYWPMISAIAAAVPVVPLGPVQDPGYQFMTRPDDVRHIELRHPCPRCREAVTHAAEMLEHAEPGTMAVCVAQCVVVYLRDIALLDGRFSPIMRTADGVGP